MALIRRSRIKFLLVLTGVLLTLHFTLTSLMAPYGLAPPPLPDPLPIPTTFTLGRVFIASNHWNSESILRSHWSDAVVSLITAIGVDNVYFSLYESGSWDDTKAALRDLDKRLEEMGVERTVILENESHADVIARRPTGDEQGWVMTSSGRKELRRIPYLAGVRNRVLEPLETLNATFDRVLFLNDVIFTVKSPLIAFPRNRN